MLTVIWGRPATSTETPDPEIDNANGTVTLIGGRLMGTTTQGMDGRVLLGTITFKGLVNSKTDLKVDLGRYHPNHPNRYLRQLREPDTHRRGR